MQHQPQSGRRGGDLSSPALKSQGQEQKQELPIPGGSRIAQLMHDHNVHYTLQQGATFRVMLLTPAELVGDKAGCVHANLRSRRGGWLWSRFSHVPLYLSSVRERVAAGSCPYKAPAGPVRRCCGTEYRWNGKLTKTSSYSIICRTLGMERNANAGAPPGIVVWSNDARGTYREDAPCESPCHACPSRHQPAARVHGLRGKRPLCHSARRPAGLSGVCPFLSHSFRPTWCYSVSLSPNYSLFPRLSLFEWQRMGSLVSNRCPVSHSSPISFTPKPLSSASGGWAPIDLAPVSTRPSTFLVRSA